jgi:hypothetical protein
MDMETFIEKEAAYNRRAVATQILFIIDEYRRKKLSELEFFRPKPQLAGRVEDEVQSFETPSAPHPEHVSKFREKLGRDST